MLESLLTTFASSHCKPEFFGIKPWYNYLQQDNQCNIVNFQVLGGSAGSDFVLIALALIDALIRIAAFVAIGYIIYGGVLYVTSQGSPEQTGKAQNTILNALIGLVIAVMAIAFVSFLGNRLSA
ncbi:MAG TPA: hypothetical protein VK978_01020 [Candidatus Saccharimonadales bacterium]|nr:hypothetical protein [Candidatus Saccharimonadales bacterium]